MPVPFSAKLAVAPLVMTGVLSFRSLTLTVTVWVLVLPAASTRFIDTA